MEADSEDDADWFPHVKKAAKSRIEKRLAKLNLTRSV
jgi:hypothetical protein